MYKRKPAYITLSCHRGAESQIVSQAQEATRSALNDGFLSEDADHRLFCDASGKLTLLRHMLPRLAARGHRVLIFSFFKIVRS